MRAGIYVHIPFCLGKCRYCSFNSIPYEAGLARHYLDSLKKETEGRLEGVEPTSIYIGGGTPTVLPEERLFGLLDVLRPEEGVEWTIEANPGTLAGLDMKRLRGLGVGRVSVGAQSFDPGLLRMLGRRHGPEDVAESVGRLGEAGFKNISVDLMYSLPGQTMGSWSDSLEAALALGVGHISIYDLTLEEGTPLHALVKSGRLTPPPETMQVEMYLMAVDILEKAGFVRYEISNFALPGLECLHNMNYWSGGDCIGLGAGAHSHLSGIRSENAPGVREYTSAVLEGASPVLMAETLTKAELEREFIMLRLRRGEGLDPAEYLRRFGVGFMRRHGAPARRLAASGHLEITPRSVRLTVKGALAGSAVTREFF